MLFRKGWVIAGIETIGMVSFIIPSFYRMANCGQHNLWQKRERRYDRPWRYGSIIRPVWSAPGYIIIKFSFNAVNRAGSGSGTIAGCKSPAIFSIMRKTQWIFNSI